MKWFFLAIFAGFLMIGGFGNAIAIGDITGYNELDVLAPGDSCSDVGLPDYATYLDSGELNEFVYNPYFHETGEIVSLSHGHNKCIYSHVPSTAVWESYWCGLVYVNNIWPFPDGDELQVHYKTCSGGCDAETGLCNPEIAVPEGYDFYTDSTGRTYRCGSCFGPDYDATGQPCFGYFVYDPGKLHSPYLELWESFGYVRMDTHSGNTNFLCLDDDLPVYFREGDTAIPELSGATRSENSYFCDSFGRTYYNSCPNDCEDDGYCADASESTETDDLDDETTGTDDETQADSDSSNAVAVDEITYDNKPGLFYKHESGCTHPDNYICVERKDNADVSLLWYCNPADDKKYYMICPTANCVPGNVISTGGYCGAINSGNTESPSVEFITDTDEAIIALDSAAGVNSVVYMFGNKVGSIYTWSDDWFWYGCKSGTSCDVSILSDTFTGNNYIAIKAYASNGKQTESRLPIE